MLQGKNTFQELAWELSWKDGKMFTNIAEMKIPLQHSLEHHTSPIWETIVILSHDMIKPTNREYQNSPAQFGAAKQQGRQESISARNIMKSQGKNDENEAVCSQIKVEVTRLCRGAGKKFHKHMTESCHRILSWHDRILQSQPHALISGFSGIKD